MHKGCAIDRKKPPFSAVQQPAQADAPFWTGNMGGCGERKVLEAHRSRTKLPLHPMIAGRGNRAVASQAHGPSMHRATATACGAPCSRCPKRFGSAVETWATCAIPVHPKASFHRTISFCQSSLRAGAALGQPRIRHTGMCCVCTAQAASVFQHLDSACKAPLRCAAARNPHSHQCQAYQCQGRWLGHIVVAVAVVVATAIVSAPPVVRRQRVGV